MQSPLWYLLTIDLDKAAPRMFRMDRISKPQPLADAIFRPNADVIWQLLPAECEWKPLSGEAPRRLAAPTRR